VNWKAHEAVEYTDSDDQWLAMYQMLSRNSPAADEGQRGVGIEATLQTPHQHGEVGVVKPEGGIVDYDDVSYA
jgi:hypothetical protein